MHIRIYRDVMVEAGHVTPPSQIIIAQCGTSSYGFLEPNVRQ